MAKHETNLRKCIVTGAILPKDGLIRFVVDPDNRVVPDVQGKLPGRGLWIRAEGDMIRAACAKGMFSRAARHKVSAPANLADQTEAVLRRRCLDLIGLAKRAGDLVGGFEKVRVRLRAGDTGLVLAASDGGEDGRAKVRALAPTVEVVELFDAAALGSAVGRERLVHAVVDKGKLAETIRHECGRLGGLAGGDRPGPMAG